MDPFVAEIRLVGFNFAPVGWAFCNGQILLIQQNTALFSLLGTTYGGDGQTTYALPLRNRTPMHPGTGPGLTTRTLGEAGGEATAVLNPSQIPAHNHGPMPAQNAPGTSGTPTAVKSLAVSSNSIYGAGNAQLVPMGDTAGENLPHENRQPYLNLNFIIALQGVFPARPL